MRLLRRLHLYLGCLFAPALIFFAVTGAWQLFRMHESDKDGSYNAPPPMKTLSAIHMNSHLPGKRAGEYSPLHTFSLLAAGGLVTTTLLGVVMAFRVTQKRLTPTLFLFAGIVIPAAILYFYR